MNNPKTTEKLLLEIMFSLLLLLAIGSMTNRWVYGVQTTADPPTIRDLHQQQEMIDYHRGEGREVVSFR